MIHRLRVIYIYEANLGALLAIEWQQLTYKLLAKDFFYPVYQQLFQHKLFMT